MYKSGFVGIIGRPNVGKSTLINAIIGEQIAITSELPQTTRNQIKGIFTTPQGQIVFIDTPGIHQSQQRFGIHLNQTAMNILADSDIDVILYMIDVTRPLGEEEQFIMENIARTKKKVLVLLNKIDNPDNFLPEYNDLFRAYTVLEISALNKTHTEDLIQTLYELLPEGLPFYDDDEITDQNMRFITAEIIRKHVIHNMQDEIPHATAVKIESYKELADKTVIDAIIYVESDSQKKIMIGKDGNKIKVIKNFSKKDLKQFIEGPITLTILVKVKDKWRKNNSFIKSLGNEN